MGRIVKVLSFLRLVRHDANVSDVKVDPGGGANITGHHFADLGDDSFPLETDLAITQEVSGTGREDVVGYLDPLNTPVAQPGDKRIYARDADSGEVVVEIWLKNDGSVTVSNDNGSLTLKVDGEIDANGATITTDGDVVTSDNISLRTHTHIGNLGSPTGPPLP